MKTLFLGLGNPILSDDRIFQVTAREIRVTGIVQGVGFRPFIYNLAKKFDLNGFVLNDSEGVLIKVEGKFELIESFIEKIRKCAPAQSRIENIAIKEILPEGLKDFFIKKSISSNKSSTMISPDIATCLDCKLELKNSKDYRFLYPFINCTNCGPRFTIIEDVPYDRVNTSMKVFDMCATCQKEYDDPSSRRFHAQPNACSQCGPKLKLFDSSGKIIRIRDILKKVARFLNAGGIIAIKGIGGFHFACNATDEEAVKKLRHRKYREEKPFALMGKDVDAVNQYCYISKTEKELLRSSRRPIVLLKTRSNSLIAGSVAPAQKYLGFMLPYTPFHHLLFEQINFPIVLTSGNLSDEPIVYQDKAAFKSLDGIADYFLTYNREIYARCDDSVTRVFNKREMLIRRARGYVPSPLIFKKGFKSNILACGGELKNTFAIGKGNQAIISHHIGDLDNLDALCAYEKSIEHFKKLFYFKPAFIAHDLHPRYLSTRYAQNLKNIDKVWIQHHHAHVASCMAENDLDAQVIGIAWDGAGYGTDGSLWGSEFMIADFSNFKRVAHLKYMSLPGGEKAIKEPWRIGLTYLYEIFGEEIYKMNLLLLRKMERSVLENVIKMVKQRINSPLSCGMGRLFDAVSSLIGLRLEANYEGQAAVELEMEAASNVSGVYSYEIDYENSPYIIKTDKIIKSIVVDKMKGLSNACISAKFHNTLVKILVEICERIRSSYHLNKVALSGGVFQNIYLLKKSCKALKNKRFDVYTHSRVPANDGGISLGQLVIANRRVDHVSRNSS